MDEQLVQAEYERLGYDRGWVFGMTPVTNLETARAVIVGLNPGGDDDKGLWQVKAGNAYFDERWYPDSDALYPIQVQMKALHELLGLGRDEVFAGQFIPFRSQSLGSLSNRAEAFAFAYQLWQWAIKKTDAKLFLCLGHQVSWRIAQILQAKPDGPPLPSGWGTTTVGRYVSGDRVVVRLPHLSRYQLFSMTGEKLEKTRRAVRYAARPVGSPPFIN